MGFVSDHHDHQNRSRTRSCCCRAVQVEIAIRRGASTAVAAVVVVGAVDLVIAGAVRIPALVVLAEIVIATRLAEGIHEHTCLFDRYRIDTLMDQCRQAKIDEATPKIDARTNTHPLTNPHTNT